MQPDPTKRLIVALDEIADLEEALALANLLTPLGVNVFKVGPRLFVPYGKEAVTRLTAAGVEVFLDMKFHDIPNTVAHAIGESAKLGVSIVNVHAAGGITMMQAAAAKKNNALLFAVTELTSKTEEDIHLQTGQPSKASVLGLARWAKLAGMDGVICSPKELVIIKSASELNGLLTIVPGIRPAGTDSNDQKRFDTPTAAIIAGADYLVIGRAITKATDTVAATQKILEEMTIAFAALKPTE